MRLRLKRAPKNIKQSSFLLTIYFQLPYRRHKGHSLVNLYSTGFFGLFFFLWFLLHTDNILKALSLKLPHSTISFFLLSCATRAIIFIYVHPKNAGSCLVHSAHIKICYDLSELWHPLMDTYSDTPPDSTSNKMLNLLKMNQNSRLKFFLIF